MKADAPGIVDLWRSVVAAAADLGRRYRLGYVVAAVLIGTYVLLRTVDADRNVLLVWAAATAALALASPVSGLVVVAAIAPFTEPLVVSRHLGLKPLLVVALAVGVGLRLVAGIARSRRVATPPIPLALAIFLIGGTLLGVVNSGIRYGGVFATDAFQAWLAGIGGGLLVLLVTVQVARRGELVPFVTAVAAGTAGGIVSLIDFVAPQAVRGPALDWLVRPSPFPHRVSGIIPAPNGTAALVIVPAAVLVAGAIFGRDARLRLLCAAGALPLLVTLYFTYSRAALLGLFALAVVVAWRIRRALGIVMVVGGLVAGIMLLPAYLQARGQAVGDYGQAAPDQALIASDVQRLTAWGAATRMWLDAPIVGQGFQAYRELARGYGDPILNAPHNEWLRLFAEEGAIVGIAGLVFVLSVLVSLARGPGWIGVGAFGAFIGWALAASFNNPTIYVQVSVIAFTVVGTGLARSIPGSRVSSDVSPD
jgi:hypothetical protein